MDELDRLIEPLMTFRSKGREYRKDERVYVSRKQCEHFCAQGWARDVSDEIPTEAAQPGNVALNVQSGSHGVEEGR